VWAMADSLNGHMSEFEVYTEKKANAVEKNLGSNVIKTLTQQCEHIQACLLQRFLYRCWFVARSPLVWTVWMRDTSEQQKGVPRGPETCGKERHEAMGRKSNLAVPQFNSECVAGQQSRNSSSY